MLQKFMDGPTCKVQRFGVLSPKRCAPRLGQADVGSPFPEAFAYGPAVRPPSSGGVLGRARTQTFDKGGSP